MYAVSPFQSLYETSGTHSGLRALKNRLYAFFGIVLIVLLAILLHSAFRKGGLWQEGRYNDFRAYHDAASYALDDKLSSAYALEERPYQYPPTLASVIVPIGLVPYRVGLVIWVLLSLGVLVCSFRVLDRVLCPPVDGLAKMVGFLFVYRLIESDFANTNANVLVLGLVVFGFALERRERSVWGGFLIALAACVKVYPILLFPWMVSPSRRRMLPGFLGGVVVWGVLVPGTVLGPSECFASYRAWYGCMMAPMAAEETAEEAEETQYVAGQSLRTLAYHLLRRTDATAHDEESISVNFTHLSRAQTEGIYYAMSIVALGLCYAVIRKRWRGGVWRGDEIAIAMALTVLLSPLARKAHFVMIWPAAAMAFAVAFTSMGKRRTVLFSLWGVALGLVLLTSPGVLGAKLSKLAMAYCPLSMSTLILIAILLVPRQGCTAHAASAPVSPCQGAESSG